jgi:hypothetical protein
MKKKLMMKDENKSKHEDEHAMEKRKMTTNFMRATLVRSKVGSDLKRRTKNSTKVGSQ